LKPILNDPPKKVLVVRLKAIGDVLLATPVLRALRKSYPAAKIHFLTHAVGEPLVRHNPHLDRVLVHPRKDGPWGDRLRFFRSLRAEGYDLVLDLESTPRSALLTLATASPVRVGYAFRVRKWAFTHPVPKNQSRKYQGEICLDLARAVGLAGDGPRTELYLGSEEKGQAKEWADRTGFSGQVRKVGLNPTGSWSAKLWPLEHWKTLIAALERDLGLKPAIFWGPGAEGTVEAIVKGSGGKCFVLPKTDLLQGAAHLAGFDLLIGNDGTPQHMAQALGTPTLTLFGPSWAVGYTPPLGPHRSLQHYLDCGPCDHTTCPNPPQGGTGRYQLECLDRILPGTVLREAGALLGTVAKGSV
jgi:ADP-heptose:LPS heptosyltransferase